jgi:hypothetical protein
MCQRQVWCDFDLGATKTRKLTNKNIWLAPNCGECCQPLPVGAQAFRSNPAWRTTGFDLPLEHL